MPMRYEEPATDEATTRYRFWITSNRGTNESEEVELPASWKEPRIKDELEEWCEQFGAWHHGENMVSYGFEPVEATDANA